MVSYDMLHDKYSHRALVKITVQPDVMQLRIEKIEKLGKPQRRGYLGWTTHHEKAVQGFLPLLGTNIRNSSVVKVPQKVQRGKPSCYRINAKNLLFVHEPGPEAVTLRHKAALATSEIGRCSV